MYRGKKFLVLGLSIASTLAAVSPAEAQYYPRDPYPRDPYQRGPGSRVADEIARGAGAAAQAVGAISDAVRSAGDSMRGALLSPAQRYAADACAVRAERYGRVSVDRVDPYKRRSWRVYGVADPARGAYSYDQRYRYDRRYAPRSFTCTVRYDGDVTRFSTRRLRS